MTRLIMCTRYKKELPGMANLPFPNAKGQELFDTVSQQAWDEWQAHQTRIINEKQLSMMDPAARTYLNEQQKKFFLGEEVDQAEGYIPENK
ncbi:MAG: oxidative damage protection protein [Sinobacterium sp.]|nr:oxidative damage protection protein [Sinobacterium sp.]